MKMVIFSWQRIFFVISIEVTFSFKHLFEVLSSLFGIVGRIKIYWKEIFCLLFMLLLLQSFFLLLPWLVNRFIVSEFFLWRILDLAWLSFQRSWCLNVAHWLIHNISNFRSFQYFYFSLLFFFGLIFVEVSVKLFWCFWRLFQWFLPSFLQSCFTFTCFSSFFFWFSDKSNSFHISNDPLLSRRMTKIMIIKLLRNSIVHKERMI